MHNLILLFRSSGVITTLAVQLASIKEHLRGDYKLTVVVTGQRSSLGNSVCVYLDNLDNEINVKYLDNVIHSEPDTLISMNACSNKLPTIVFSSSVIISRDINVSLLEGGAFSACASNGFNNLESDQNIWQSLYAKSGVDNRGMCLKTRIGGRIVPPIFEMDIIVINNPKKLAKHWRSMHEITVAHEDLKSKPLLAWKFSLGLAVMMANYKYTLIREDCSYPIDFKPLNNHILPSAFVYRNTESLCSERAIRKLFHDLTIDNKPLEEMINSDKSWSPVLKVVSGHLDQNEITSSQLQEQKPFIVDGALTGIPRSGTSYLVALLNKTKRTVVINEPS